MRTAIFLFWGDNSVDVDNADADSLSEVDATPRMILLRRQGVLNAIRLLVLGVNATLEPTMAAARQNCFSDRDSRTVIDDNTRGVDKFD